MRRYPLKHHKTARECRLHWHDHRPWMAVRRLLRRSA